MTRALEGHSAELENLGVIDATEADNEAWTNPETTELPDPKEVCEPFAWKVLIMPMRPKGISDGGILIPTTVQAHDVYLNYVGRIVALGPLAFKHEKWHSMKLRAADTPKRGDWMLYPVYNYQRVDFKGKKLILLNDDSFLARIPKGVSPWDFKLER